MNANEVNSSNSSAKTKYTVCKVLRKEKDASVYLAKDSQNNLFTLKSVAINEMSEMERKVLDRINIIDHPFILKQKEHFFTKRKNQMTINIVMEYIAGGDLSQRIKAKKTQYISETLILDWFTQLCLAVKHLHDRNILHRLLKPSNIFLVSDSHIKLGDFGVAKCLNNAKERAVTSIGTPEYISPEILLNRPYSFKSDIWAMGVTLFELCALKVPFNQEELNYIQSVKQVPNVVSKIPKHYSKEIKNIISLILKADPIDRLEVNQLLSMKIIQKRIAKFLTKEQYNSEFSNTIIANELLIDYSQRKECDKCIKAKQDSFHIISAISLHPNKNNNDTINSIEKKVVIPIKVYNTNIHLSANKKTNMNQHFNAQTEEYKENDIIKKSNCEYAEESSNLIHNYHRDSYIKEKNNKSAFDMRRIKKENDTIAIHSELNIESKRKELEDSIGVTLMKDIYVFIIKSSTQIECGTTNKSITQDLYEYLIEKYEYDEVMKGLKRVDEIQEVILKESKLSLNNN